MSRMSAPKYVPFYDLFKLIVAISLTVILFLLLLRERTAPLRQTQALATQTIARTELPAATSIPTATPTSRPTPTSSPLPPTQAFPTSDVNACPSSPSHIQVGDKVRVRSWLNFRTGPSLNWPIIHTNTAGTIMEVIGGPICTTRNTTEGSKAYLWWSVRMDNGQEGWSAEAPLLTPDYFLEPIQ